jgi:hypothetical protein
LILLLVLDIPEDMDVLGPFMGIEMELEDGVTRLGTL